MEIFNSVVIIGEHIHTLYCQGAGGYMGEGGGVILEVTHSV